MMRLVLVAVAVTACSPSLSPQPIDGRKTVAANSLYFWRVTSSTLEWGACSEASDFRKSVSALPFGPNSYVIYKTDAMSTVARTQACTALDPMTCQDSASNVVFKIAGTDLVFSRDVFKEPLRVRDRNGVERDSACQMTQLETWTLHDQGLKFEMEVTNALGLEESEPPSGECDQIERSVDGGIRGCIISFKLAGDLR